MMPVVKRARLEDGTAMQDACHLRDCCNKFIEDTETLAEEVAAAKARKPIGIIKLNVGGLTYITDAADIHRQEGSMLASMFSGRTQPGFMIDGDAVFIKRDGVLFRHVLNYLWEGRIWKVPDDVDKRALKREAEYYSLPEMVHTLERAIRSTLVLSPVCFLNIRVLPETNTLFLSEPSKPGQAIYGAGDLRSYTVSFQLHFPKTCVFVGICTKPEATQRGFACWGVSLNAQGTNGMQFIGDDVVMADRPHPAATRELRMFFTSGPTPQLACCIDGSPQIDIAGEFGGERAIPPNQDM